MTERARDSHVDKAKELKAKLMNFYKTSNENLFSPVKADPKDWLNHWTEQDKKGLKLIEAIYKHKGTK